MPDVLFGAGVDVIIDPPEIPDFRMDPPPATDVIVLPVAGPRGPAGAAGGAHFTFTQASPAATWTIVHNLGAYPIPVLLLDDDLTVPVNTDVTYPDDNTAVVTWPIPVSGRAEF